MCNPITMSKGPLFKTKHPTKNNRWTKYYFYSQYSIQSLESNDQQQGHILLFLTSELSLKIILATLSLFSFFQFVGGRKNLHCSSGFLGDSHQLEKNSQCNTLKINLSWLSLSLMEDTKTGKKLKWNILSMWFWFRSSHLRTYTKHS